ncbi:23S rRNA pseudouridine2604 synthase, partial [Cupriavidus sp. YR651]|uniref:pseudouridine synthase n=1 Tax=Cupriavidus sp. YR651 TaxID=1855315 RepID=UPI00088D91BA
DNESRPPRRYGDDERRPPQRGSDDNRPPRPRSFGDNDSRPPRPRSFGDNESRPPRRYGDDERRPPQRGFSDDNRAPRPRRAGGDDSARPAAPARRFSDNADRARPVRTERPAPRTEAHEQREAHETDESGLVRLSKRMSELGLCSRREADEWIPRGWVLVDGKPVTELGSRVRPDAEVEILQAARSEQGERVTVLLNKPVGYVSGQAEDGYEPAAVLFAPENQWAEDPTRKRFAPWQRKNLAPAGRLDIDSTGLLVLTQDGRVARALIGDDSNVEKEYLVRVVWESPEGPVERNISAAFPADQLERLRHGLSLDDVPLKPAKVSWQNEEQLRFVLREGRKRQIRRMCEQVGLKVIGLKRVRMGRVVLGDLPPGQWRFLGPFEKF